MNETCVVPQPLFERLLQEHGRQAAAIVTQRTSRGTLLFGSLMAGAVHVFEAPATATLTWGTIAELLSAGRVAWSDLTPDQRVALHAATRSELPWAPTVQ